MSGKKVTKPRVGVRRHSAQPRRRVGMLLPRQSICFQIHDLVIGLFINRYEFEVDI